MFCYPLTGHSNLMFKLIKRGAIVNAMDYHGTTALHLACQRGHGSAAVSQRLNRRKPLAVIHATSAVAKRFQA